MSRGALTESGREWEEGEIWRKILLGWSRRARVSRMAWRGAHNPLAMGYSTIMASVRDGVAVITLNRPEKLNALSMGPGGTRSELLAALADADADDRVGAILVRAEGRAFCAGGDLAGAETTETPFDEYLFNQDVLSFHNGIRATRKPIVAAVQGLCLGAGLGMLVQFDLVVAADDSRFGLVEGRIGHPGATELVPVIGAQWAKFLILSGELIDAATAREIGLVLATVEPARLDSRAFDLAGRIASLPRESTQLNKASITLMEDVMGRFAGRIAGRAGDVSTKGQAAHARAPDGRTFAEILASEGVEGMKQAREAQFRGAWLEPKRARKPQE